MKYMMLIRSKVAIFVLQQTCDMRLQPMLCLCVHYNGPSPSISNNCSKVHNKIRQQRTISSLKHTCMRTREARSV